MRIISRDKHNISRKNISKNTLKILYRLNKAGFESYLVGGGVRDLLLGKKPKDFDITTNATPEQIRQLFKNCRLIGKRFRLVHIFFGHEIIEVSTFRSKHKSDNNKDYNLLQYEHNGMLLRDNNFGTIEDDAQRRDITINCLYYNIKDFSVRDYVDGLNDLHKGTIRLIGDPETRYREDPIRMLRVARFSGILNMKISYKTAEPIPRLAYLLQNVAPSRLFEETIKLFQHNNSHITYYKLCKYQLFQQLFPTLSKKCTKNRNNIMERLLIETLKNNNYFFKNKFHLNEEFLFASMFWYSQLDATNIVAKEKIITYYDAFVIATNITLIDACSIMTIPKRITILIRDIWILQLRMLPYQEGKCVWKLLKHPKFHEAYKLLMLRAKVENNIELIRLSKWWSEFQISSPLHQKHMINNMHYNQSTSYFNSKIKNHCSYILQYVN